MMATFGAVDTEVALTRSVILTIDDFRKGASNPADEQIGTTPEINSLALTATNDLVDAHVAMPIDWDKSVDCTFDLVFCLRATETDSDVLSITVDYNRIKKNTTAQGPDKASTQLTPTATVTTANGLAVNDVYVVSGTLAQADGTNGFAADDNTAGFCFQFHLTNTTGVSSIKFIGGCINYEAKY